ncbi:MAG: hypothetical protein AAGI71_13885 [Bacteroidota bacterium]
MPALLPRSLLGLAVLLVPLVLLGCDSGEDDEDNNQGGRYSLQATGAVIVSLDGQAYLFGVEDVPQGGADVAFGIQLGGRNPSPLNSFEFFFLDARPAVGTYPIIPLENAGTLTNSEALLVATLQDVPLANLSGVLIVEEASSDQLEGTFVFTGDGAFGGAVEAETIRAEGSFVARFLVL